MIDEETDMGSDPFLHNLLVTMQAAYIEWKYGRGSEAAMEWIENTLDGPDLIPSPEMPTDAGKWHPDAQEFFDANEAPITKRGVGMVDY